MSYVPTHAEMATRQPPAARGNAINPPAWALAALFATLLIASIAMQIWRDRAFPYDPAEQTVLYVQSGGVMQRLALSFDALLSDVYWIRAIQHYGGSRQVSTAENRYGLLYPLLSLAVDLDPYFSIVYRFGSIFLAEPWPGGPGRPDQAVELLRRGLNAQPTNWRYMQDIGFVYYWWVHDFKAAGEWFERGGQQPGAPWWLNSLAATTFAQGGDRDASRVLWRALAESDNEWLQRSAVHRLRQLDALDQVDRLQKVVTTAIERGLPKTYSWEALVRGGYLRGIPVDPTGVPYELGPWSGDVSVSYESALQPLPSEPPKGQKP